MLDSIYYVQLLWGLVTTIELFVIAWIMAFSLAIILVTLRATNIAICRWIVNLFIAYHRSVPLLVQVMFWYFGVPEILPQAAKMWLYDHNAEMSLAAIALALGSSAYMAEDMESGLRSIPPTQFEAAYALGCNFIQSMRYIIIPQALRISIPPLISRALLLFKNTSVAMAIGVMELSYRTREIDTETYKTFATFAAATVLYLCGTFLLIFIGSRIQSFFNTQTRSARNG